PRPPEPSAPRRSRSTCLPATRRSRAADSARAGEQRAVRFDPAVELLDAFARGDLRRPAQLARRLADVADEDALIARAPIGVADVELAAAEGVEIGDQIERRHLILSPAADVVDLPGRDVDAIDRGQEGVHDI